LTAIKETVKFGVLEINRRVVQALTDMGFEEPTPIQQQTVPLLQEGRDVIGQAQTGTGKTAAFGIPIIEMANTRHGGVQALIVTPTRELAIQVAEEISRIGKYRRVRTLPIYGGQSIDRQIRGLRQGVQVVIGTPGRLLDHLSRKTLSLDNVKVVVLDEADEMLDMGFIDDIESILQATPERRQTLLFSATMPEEIRMLARRYLNNPEFITVSKQNLTVPLIEQVYYETREPNKLESLCRILDSMTVTLAIIFCRTKRGVDELVAGLQARGYPAARCTAT
jgi:ATP-dependent RNA helicase DeaD